MQSVVLAYISDHFHSLFDFSCVSFPGAQAYNKSLASMKASMVGTGRVLGELINISLLPFLKIYILA